MADLDLRSVAKPVRWRGIRWRSAVLVLMFCCALAAFMMGADVNERPGIAEAGVLTQAYYALGLFVLGGLDLGVPHGGPAYARAMLWVAYFGCPLVTASALVEGLLRVMRPRTWALRRLRGHIVIAGCGKLTMLYLARLRSLDRRVPVVVVEPRADGPYVDEAREAYGAMVVTGDITSDILLAMLRVDRARRVLLLTGDDFANLDAATRILGHAPQMGGRVVVHIGDLRFLRVMNDTRVAAQCEIFNTHQIAAEHLVKEWLLPHFIDTEAIDTVVLAGFGRFGQTVLDKLQELALGRFDRAIIIDLQCDLRQRVFAEQVGFEDGYQRDIVNGDLADPDVWRALEERHGIAQCAAAFVLGSGDDGVNLQTALWLSSRYTEPLIVARSFRRSEFADEVARDGGFKAFSVAELVTESIPKRWIRRARRPRARRRNPAPNRSAS